MGSSRVGRRPRGFTLLELLVVVALLALIAATATVRLSSSYRRAQLRRAAQVVEEIDRFARQLSRAQQRPLVLRINLQDNRFLLAGSERSREDPLRTWRAPSPIALGAAVTARKDRKTGEVIVRYDPHGRGECYAVQVEAPSGNSRWLLFSGLSGQLVEGLTEDEIKETLRALTKNRVNPD